MVGGLFDPTLYRHESSGSEQEQEEQQPGTVERQALLSARSDGRGAAVTVKASPFDGTPPFCFPLCSPFFLLFSVYVWSFCSVSCCIVLFCCCSLGGCLLCFVLSSFVRFVFSFFPLYFPRFPLGRLAIFAHPGAMRAPKICSLYGGRRECGSDGVV